MNKSGVTPRAEIRRAGLVLFALLWAFSTAVTIGPFLALHTLNGDNLRDYSFFYNNVQSLHEHGEPAWWFPNTQMGYPGYFFSILGITNCGLPAFALVAAVAWLFGHLGLALPAMHTLYVLYFGALVPLLFLIGVWLVTRELFRSPSVIAFVLVAAAFSPGVVTNVSDFGGLEHTAYALYFAAALARFLRTPASRRAFLILGAATCLLGLSFNYLFLVTTAPLLACLALWLVMQGAFRRRIREILHAQRAWRWLALAALVAICALPNVLTLRQGSELGQRDSSELTYTFADLKPGNPWEILAASSPAVGFEWDSYFAHTDGTPNAFVPRGMFKARDHVSYGYLGLLVWPLAAWGLLHGRARLRIAAWTALALLFGVLLLSAYSPAFAAVLVLPTPLRGMNHFSDLLYRDGGFLILLWAAGLGLEAITRGRGAGFLPLFGVIGGASILLTAKLHDFELSMISGFPVLVGVFAAFLLHWCARGPGGRPRRVVLALLVTLTLIDVSTIAGWYERQILVRHAWHVKDTPHADGLGIAQPRPNRGSDRAFHYHAMSRLRREGLPVDDLPLLAVYGRGHFHSVDPDGDDFRRALTAEGEGEERSLAVASLDDPVTRASLASVLRSPGARVGAGARLVGRTFNAMTVHVETGGPALLFVREAFSPYWTARVNDEPAPIVRTLGVFKAVAVPAGRSEVRLRFRPAGLGLSLAAAYAILAGFAVAAVAARDGRSREAVAAAVPASSAA